MIDLALHQPRPTPASAEANEHQARRPSAPLSPECRRKRAIMDWRHNAACLGENTELFFPVGTTGPAIDQIERAKGMCRRCPVAVPCLEWALATGQDAGIWGGLSEDERRTLRRSRQRRRHIAS